MCYLAENDGSSADVERCPSQPVQPANPWRKDRVELQEDQKYDADIRGDNAQEHGDSVKHLIGDDAAFGSSAYLVRHLLFQETCPPRIAPTGEEGDPKQEQIEPVHYQGNTIRDECSQEPRRERHKRNGQQEGQMDPGEVAIASCEMVELCLLADPENAEGEKAHDIRKYMRHQST
jgi:hypothetical protein